ncbi:acyl-CoA dehydrogenase family protein [Mycolicibacterium vaccae]|uniref:acyl-CoA dehydrogenase family protein n=1 Tax=Mycolicibacterium vaccae TaxID=1810 RepID=UPI003D08CB0F
MTAAELDRAAVPADFVFTEEHQALRGVLRELFADPRDTQWRTLLADVGADEIVFDAVAGSDAATAIDLAILAEEAGAALFDGPVLAGALVGVTAAALDRPDLVAPLRAGAATVGALVEGGASFSGGAESLDVTAEPVWNGAGAQHILVWGTFGDQPAVALLPTGGAQVVPLSGLDLSRPLARYTGNGVRPLAWVQGEDARALGTALRRTADLVTAAELLGVAQHAFDGTVEYVSKRVQFGRTVGSFQAVKHRLVDLLTAVELARSAVYGAAWGLARGQDDLQTDIDLATAGLLTRRAALSVGKATIQLHGGIAITWEHWAHRYFRRAHAVVALTGTPGGYARALADLIDRRDGADD